MKDLKLLLVDDEKGFLDYTARRLRARGFCVETAATGAAALDHIRENEVDVVVLDILMPGMDGVTTLEAIKSLKPDVQVLLLTGHGTQRTADQSKELGAAFYLLKPIDFDSLLDAIDKAHDRGCGHGEEG